MLSIKNLGKCLIQLKEKLVTMVLIECDCTYNCKYIFHPLKKIFPNGNIMYILFTCCLNDMINLVKAYSIEYILFFDLLSIVKHKINSSSWIFKIKKCNDIILYELWNYIWCSCSFKQRIWKYVFTNKHLDLYYFSFKSIAVLSTP